MRKIINNLNVKTDLLKTLIEHLPYKEPYENALSITNRTIRLTERIVRLRFAIVYFLYINEMVDEFGKRKISITEHMAYEYEIYLNTIIIETSVLFSLSKGTSKESDSMLRLFNDVKKHLFSFKEANIANDLFNLKYKETIFIDSHKTLKDLTNKLNKELLAVKIVRDEFSAHHDISFSLTGVDMQSIISLFIELTKVWYDLCEGMGVITPSSETKLWDLDDYYGEANNLFKQSSLFYENEEK